MSKTTTCSVREVTTRWKCRCSLAHSRESGSNSPGALCSRRVGKPESGSIRLARSVPNACVNRNPEAFAWRALCMTCAIPSIAVTVIEIAWHTPSQCAWVNRKPESGSDCLVRSVPDAWVNWNPGPPQHRDHLPPLPALVLLERCHLIIKER